MTAYANPVDAIAANAQTRFWPAPHRAQPCVAWAIEGGQAIEVIEISISEAGSEGCKRIDGHHSTSRVNQG